MNLLTMALITTMKNKMNFSLVNWNNFPSLPEERSDTTYNKVQYKSVPPGYMANGCFVTCSIKCPYPFKRHIFYSFEPFSYRQWWWVTPPTRYLWWWRAVFIIRCVVLKSALHCLRPTCIQPHVVATGNGMLPVKVKKPPTNPQFVKQDYSKCPFSMNNQRTTSPL